VFNITDRFGRKKVLLEHKKSLNAKRRRSRDRMSMGSGVSLGDPDNSER